MLKGLQNSGKVISRVHFKHSRIYIKWSIRLRSYGQFVRIINVWKKICYLLYGIRVKKGKDMSMGKNNTIIKQWLSDEKRMASLVNGCLIFGKTDFQKGTFKKRRRCTRSDSKNRRWEGNEHRTLSGYYDDFG